MLLKQPDKHEGTKALGRVTVRFYLLDSTGQRIAEKDFTQVSSSSMGNNSPLRPGYQKDFGYSVEDSAPTGWSRRIEAEIVDLEFMDN
jgi:hypothetical protein